MTEPAEQLEDTTELEDFEDIFMQPIKSEKLLPIWGYLFLFFVPAISVFLVCQEVIGMTILYSGITSLAIMNGSINIVIAWMTIRLDGHSNEALDHLETIMDEMDKLEDTLNDASKMVTGFTGDLGEAQELFRRVGVNLTDLDLESIADVVSSLKENKTDLNDILANLRDVDVQMYIEEVKSIDWQALLAGINDVMAFIKTKNVEPSRAPISQVINNIPSFDDDIPIDDELDDFEDEFSLIPKPSLALKLKRAKGLSLKRR